MSLIGREASFGAARGGRSALAPASPHRVVVIASPESAAWSAAFDNREGVLVLDPLRAPDADVIGPLQPPNVGPPHRAIPRWAVYDFAEMPGAVIGLLRTPIASPYTEPLDPLALVLATPHAEPGAWHLYGLTVRSLSPSLDVREVRLRMIRCAVDLLRAERVTLVLPWSAPTLDGLPSLGCVEVLAATTPLHGPIPAATVLLYGEGASAPCAAEPPAFTIPFNPSGLPPVVARLQYAIEEGRRFLLAPAAPDRRGPADRARLLIREIES